MKQIFRHLIGEFNGEYLKSLHHFHNFAMSDLVDIFYYWSTVQWLPPGKGTSESSEIRQKDAVGIAHIAGLFSPVVTSRFASGSVRFAGPMEQSNEYSEQSVQAFLDGAIKYIANLEGHDISYYATNYKVTVDSQGTYVDRTYVADKDSTQIGMVPDDAVPIGYLVPDVVLPSGYTMDVVSAADDTISVKVRMVDTEPVSGIYLPYYGPQYAWFDNTIDVQILLEENQALFMQLLECMQHIRYNGASFADFMLLTNVLLGGYVSIAHIDQIEGKPYAMQVYYSTNVTDETIPVNERSMRLEAWGYFVGLKFPQYRIEDGELPRCTCTIHFDSSIENDWTVTGTPVDAPIYYTLDGTDPRFSDTRVLDDGTRHSIESPVYVRAFTEKGVYGGLEYTSSPVVDRLCEPFNLYYDGTIDYNGDYTYRG